MAIAKTKVDSWVEANKDRLVYDLVFSGNYATGGESFLPSDVGLRAFVEVIVHGGVAAAADLATAIPTFYNHPTNKFTFYEGSAAGTALSEKTNAEVYPTGAKMRVTIVGR